MILVDTSIWVDHLRSGRRELVSLLNEGVVSCHPFVIGELACDTLQNRDEILTLLAALPTATVASHEEALFLVSDRGLDGNGLGWVDVHLLASALLTKCSLWTRDKALESAAASLNVGA